jgi:glucan biosynthesis protein
VTLKDVDGKKLTAGKDYEKTLRYTYDQAASCKTAAGESVSRSQGDAVEDTDIVPAGTVIRVTAVGMGAYAGKNAENASLSCTYRIVTGDISKATVKAAAKAYLNGQKVTLDATDLSVTTRGGTALVEGRDYVIDEDTYVNNTDKGKASVTIRGIGDYGGEKKVTFTIGSKSIFWWKTNH